MAASWVQADADERNVANMTDLTVRGIIAIYAMSEMSRVAGNRCNTTRFISRSATTFMHEWQALELAGDAAHPPFSYSSCASSRVLAYHMYASTIHILETGLISQ
ncbi:hypothetical protein WOLCODRAFT_151898 [Wolfiporia cocos MD-104 SS10]|uniref:Glutaminase A central domain-containing protein n=1 Tax=Wolfiporia cocos (strain MD-104) TaxID=742152 RepID=A0A2H3JJ23_WOLCO|nr:hypothetical protein WOLCODRAFT_151898 [Wolfiporia cocos MD-104 SS10]